MMRWECGRATVDDLITRGRLTRVAPNRELAESYLTQARQHSMSAAAIVAEDPPGAFQLVYDAARKSLAAILVNQGLRPRGQGAHAVLLEVVLAQLEPPRQEVFREFDWMRRIANRLRNGHPSGSLDSEHASILNNKPDGERTRRSR